MSDIQEPAEKKARTDDGPLMEIPRLDMNDFVSGDEATREKFVQDLGNAFQQLGFVRLVGHGIDQELIDSVYGVAKDFFYSDAEKKKSTHIEGIGGARGFTPFGVEHAKGNSNIDLKEFYHIGQELEGDDHPLRSEYHPNVWPEWIPDFKTKSLELYRAFEKSAATMLEALALYCKVDRDFFKPIVKDGNSILRVIWYPPVEETMPKGAIRAAQHEDINLITLLPTATASGLQIKRPSDGEWIDCKDAPGEIIVDSGDMFAHMANFGIPATTHRVVNPEDTKSERFSMPFFMHPHPHALLDPDTMPWIADQGRAERVKPITAGEFLTQRLREIGLLKAETAKDDAATEAPATTTE